MQLPTLSGLQKELSARYGFRIPDAFALFVLHAIEESSKDGFFDYWKFFNYYHFFDFNMPFQVNHEDEWQFNINETYEEYYCYGMPPELCMFGNMDSLRFGYIVHDPSLNNCEWPVGKVGEMDLGVIKYGDNTKEGIESLVSFARMRYRKFNQEQKSYAVEANLRFEKLKELFHLDLSRVSTPPEFNETFDFAEKKVQATPFIPEGWRFEQAVDGIGVLAPKEMFADYKIENLEDTEDIEKLMGNGHYATALHSLRETLWLNWHGGHDEFYGECAGLMKQCYLKMNRPKYAERMQVQIDYQKGLSF